MTTSTLLPSFASTGATSRAGVSYDQKLADRFAKIDELFIEPAVASLEKVYAYCVQEAEVDELPLTGLDPNDFGGEVAFAQREAEIATSVRALITSIRTEYDALRERAIRPLPTISRTEQFAAMLAQARDVDCGNRQQFTFSSESTVIIDVGVVQVASDFYRLLIQTFVEEWECGMDAVWAADRAAGRPAPDIAKLPVPRLAMQPSFIFFTMLPSIHLNRTDALTLVAIGTILGLWDCYPGSHDHPPADVPAADLPIVTALTPLLEVAMAARTSRDGRAPGGGAH